MPLSQLRNVNFGRTRLNATGSTGVGYQLLDETGTVQSSRTTTGVYQTAPGIYAAYISFPDNFRGQVLWDTGTAFLTASYATEQYNVEENDPRVALTYANTNYITSSVDYISSTLHVVSGTISSIQTQVTQMSGTLNNVYDLVFDLSGTINILSSSVNAISSSATLISSSAAIIDNSVSMLSGAIADLAGITGTLGSIESKIDRLVNIEYGRWHIINNQMIFYKEDNTTEVARFNLFDDSGNPTMDAVFERVKV